jgi:hypothetical protein
MKIAQWQVSPRKDKKYRVILTDGSKVDFGSRFHQQFKDATPLKAFSHLDHGDKKRRDLYFKRHNKDYPPYSPDWLSKKYLW